MMRVRLWCDYRGRFCPESGCVCVADAEEDEVTQSRLQASMNRAMLGLVVGLTGVIMVWASAGPLAAVGVMVMLWGNNIGMRAGHG